MVVQLWEISSPLYGQTCSRSVVNGSCSRRKQQLPQLAAQLLQCHASLSDDAMTGRDSGVHCHPTTPVPRKFQRYFKLKNNRHAGIDNSAAVLSLPGVGWEHVLHLTAHMLRRVDLKRRFVLKLKSQQ
jgi:hypothetical protein